MSGNSERRTQNSEEIKRAVDWPEKLAAFLKAREKTRFAWGRHDCALFVCDAIREMTGVDPAAGYRGFYGSQREAMRVVRHEARRLGIAARGFYARVELLAVAEAQALGFATIGRSVAQRGDVLLVKDPKTQRVAFAVMGLEGAPVGAGRRGLVKLPMETVVRAWRV